MTIESGLHYFCHCFSRQNQQQQQQTGGQQQDKIPSQVEGQNVANTPAPDKPVVPRAADNTQPAGQTGNQQTVEGEGRPLL